MGVHNLWEIIKPYAKYEGYDYIRNKKVAVDLSYWIVQHQTALNSSPIRNPHLRLTFFRTINLFSKFGAYPVFIVDGKPSPLKSQARIARFFRNSGLDMKDLSVAEQGVSVERNKFFVKCVDECVELLKLLGMPVLTATGEAEALCAQLNSEGFVDTCFTADSDTFLFGAKCVIKHLDPKAKGPIECYHMEDVEAGLGIKRKHLVAISLLVGSDHNLNGVHGIGIETALRLVKHFSENEVLQRLSEIGTGAIQLDAVFDSVGKSARNSGKILKDTKTPHCSSCGHPGSKTAHRRAPCQYCHSTVGTNCKQKSSGFKCACSSCNREREYKEYKKNENWLLRVCKKIADCSFSSHDIAEMYLKNKDDEGFRPCISWKEPDVELLVDFLGYYLHWEPSYVRKRIFPMLSTIFLRQMALSSSETLLQGQYEFDSIEHIKVRCGHQFYEVKWRKSTSVMSRFGDSVSSEGSILGPTPQAEEIQMVESTNCLDELDMPQFHIDGGNCFVLTFENLELVQNAFPTEVDRFLQQKEMKESKRRKSRYSEVTSENTPAPSSRGVQLAITNYYRSSKQPSEAKSNLDVSVISGSEYLKGKNKVSTATLPKSVRRRLLFD